MGITANHREGTKTIENAYFRVERIWGSKAEGWNAWIGVYAKEGDTNLAVPLFSINAPYVDGENPFTALYGSLDTYLQNVEARASIEAHYKAAQEAAEQAAKALEEAAKLEVTEPKVTKRKPKAPK